MRWPGFNPGTWKRLRTASETDGTEKVVRDDMPIEVAPHLLLGQRGERLAAEYLERLGYTLVASNFALPVGRSLRGALVHADIDLIAYDGSTLCLLEVKTRRLDWFD